MAPQTRLRNNMFKWLETEGAAYRTHTPGTTNYLRSVQSANRDGPNRKPFPGNPAFISESILSEELRNEIYDQVVNKKNSVRAGKTMALPYARAVHEMVPCTPLFSNPHDRRPHESINDLPVHPTTSPQIFYPVSESRRFTRSDAGRVFSAAPALPHYRVAKEESDPDATVSFVTQHPHRIEQVGKGANKQGVLQPADARIPHPHLIAHERRRITHPEESRENNRLYQQRLREAEKARKAIKDKEVARKEAELLKVQPESSRFDFHFKDVVVSKETTGPDGRGHAAPGRRYGIPSYDRKRGQVKIPTSVQV
ncbi:mitochondrial 37S ribosomal protein mS45 [Aspergillus tanneri]|uniref:Uncharacterized protein n=1 Tax=Aspergillus tanneri TaxID=1220188 RepID=A0A5M9M8S8_9EURO|nr:uncharacterized protein ATNIH1004_010829 [Aspergillus tanneri]KAA8641890.1 hypothetical protein ATNIH1004_010829 [Aspergillus tanneri]